MDKVYMKQFFRGAGYPVLPSCWFLRRVWDEDPRAVMDQIEKELSYPVFVKPASLGSSHRCEQGKGPRHFGRSAEAGL